MEKGVRRKDEKIGEKRGKKNRERRRKGNGGKGKKGKGKTLKSHAVSVTGLEYSSVEEGAIATMNKSK